MTCLVVAINLCGNGARVKLVEGTFFAEPVRSVRLGPGTSGPAGVSACTRMKPLVALGLVVPDLLVLPRALLDGIIGGADISF